MAKWFIRNFKFFLINLLNNMDEILSYTDWKKQKKQTKLQK